MGREDKDPLTVTVASAKGVAGSWQLSHRWGTTTSTDGAKSVWAWFDRHPTS